MVDGLGENVIDILNGPNAVAALTRCTKIGKLTASKIKQSWDAGRGAGRTSAISWLSCAVAPNAVCLIAADTRRHPAERAVPAATWVDSRPGTAGCQSARRAHGSSCARGSIPRHAGRSCHLWVRVSLCLAAGRNADYPRRLHVAAHAFLLRAASRISLRSGWRHMQNCPAVEKLLCFTSLHRQRLETGTHTCRGHSCSVLLWPCFSTRVCHGASFSIAIC